MIGTTERVIIRSMNEIRNQSVRTLHCRGCWTEGRCVVELTYNENGRVTRAEVLELGSGWAYRPYGDAGGTAPYCPECLTRTP